ncbi:YaaR family protein [Ectobacillus sp. SYSU M60031]|uniref:YaaR family protein n=1 Tax=Ectobacillus ponti TaxID=2961894 RepID=A0AA41X4K9_9BACI|nr:YaaR family protein [Ectobacillus ponti]
MQQQTQKEQSASSSFHLGLQSERKTEGVMEKMGKLVESIGKIKEKMETDLTLDNISEYKSAVKSFLNFYVDNVLQYKDVHSRHPKYGYAQKMTIIEQVENGLKEAEDVLSLINTKTGHLEMLNKIGEIHGLILDLVL